MGKLKNEQNGGGNNEQEKKQYKENVEGTV